MAGRIALEAIILLLLVIANGIFAMSELAVMSARRARLLQRAERGDRGAREALALASSPGSFLSSVQIGITLIGILVGAIGGATLAGQIAAWLNRVAALRPYSETIGVAAVVLVTTYLSLVIGELAPKRIALIAPERIAARVARPMRVLAVLAGPAVRLLTRSTDALLALLRVRPSTEPPITGEEVTLLVEQGLQAGVFEQTEYDIVERVLRLDERRVSLLMTPRREIVWLDARLPAGENWRRACDSGHTVFPVCDGSLDRTLGLVTVRDLWAQMVAGQAPDLRALLRPALYIPENARALQLLALLRESRAGAALVISEHGGVEGLITTGDVLEAILGEMPARTPGADEPAIVPQADGSWLIDGRLPADELADLLDQESLREPAAGRFDTLAGFVLLRLGRIPAAADAFTWGGWRFEVTAMDGLRVDRVRVSRAAASPPPAAV